MGATRSGLATVAGATAAGPATGATAAGPATATGTATGATAAGPATAMGAVLRMRASPKGPTRASSDRNSPPTQSPVSERRRSRPTPPRQGQAARREPSLDNPIFGSQDRRARTNTAWLETGGEMIKGLTWLGVRTDHFEAMKSFLEAAGLTVDHGDGD